ncbi:preprotein translocase subunit SecY [candidate division WWE3 bacterium CG08_land_8_20_14_0_20_41_10]|uniref:Protein translocase subunit SecY n=1 Tax=candidate division WWE3 bacterium CG08_land_8_20_14_0_20_41_10 TaxID=1975085 RepID=A0A2H0XDN2_UNCKA|nr:MAG: preprotein translocase subunit SecY [candidate division WWE3 bacterium CG08_land_8_20_14_0_20_41_10]
MLKKKIIFTLFIIVIFRVLANIPVPGVDITAIRNYLSGNAVFGMLNLFSGGGFSNFSLVTLGLGPYINASIIMQIFTVVVPKLEELSKEGEFGREKINQYTKIITIPIALLQSYGMYFLLMKQGIITPLPVINLVVFMLTLVGGSMLLTWIGDLLTEKGIGNGISMLIFVGIVDRLPSGISQFYLMLNAETILRSVAFLVLAVIVIAGVVMVNEAVRNIPVEYGRRESYSQKNPAGVTSSLPIKVNQAGVIPIIFAVSVVMLPNLIASPLSASGNPALARFGDFLLYNFTATSILYNVFYFSLVVGFTYFYTSFQFDPVKIADDIKKRGGFIPGVRPGKNTTDYLRTIINRITLGGACFLGLIAILPSLAGSYFGLGNMAIGGTGLLIVVSVVLETVRQIKSIKATKSYENFLN